MITSSPSSHLVRFSGIFGPAAAWRSAVVPVPECEGLGCRVEKLAAQRYTSSMSSKAQVLTDALHLKPADRADVAAALLASLDSAGDPGARAAWDSEAARRAAELDSGKVKAISAAEFWSRLRDDPG